MRDCLLRTLARTTNLPYSLDGYLWAIGALAAERNYQSDVLWKPISYISYPLTNCGYG